ncbi:hypothetical protein [Cryobacterium sp. TMS1-13-1]|uniref:hypothetical protein n=1 Tax=Cryobacterium sp. TMS1-13-1 TaxID=1259220 RepID=UPI00106D0F11|nr:hypothetical protein [Cryobacterium sp. TMS1-13-1]TFD23281.1 hypothetical protein E3T31_04770 [Cryobacterium sp. TMS1-13-1]
MGAMRGDSESDFMVTGVIAFALGERPVGPFTVTVLVEDVSRADAPSTIVGGVRFDHPAFTAAEAVEVPFSVIVPADAQNGIRRLNLRAHVRQEFDSREPLAHGAPRTQPLGDAAPGEPTADRPDITEGDFVSTQSHPVLPKGSVRVPVQRV